MPRRAAGLNSPLSLFELFPRQMVAIGRTVWWLGLDCFSNTQESLVSQSIQLRPIEDFMKKPVYWGPGSQTTLHSIAPWWISNSNRPLAFLPFAFEQVEVGYLDQIPSALGVSEACLRILGCVDCSAELLVQVSSASSASEPYSRDKAAATL